VQEHGQQVTAGIQLFKAHQALDLKQLPLLPEEIQHPALYQPTVKHMMVHHGLKQQIYLLQYTTIVLLGVQQQP